jgi:hypothetical protein
MSDRDIGTDPSLVWGIRYINQTIHTIQWIQMSVCVCVCVCVGGTA